MKLEPHLQDFIYKNRQGGQNNRKNRGIKEMQAIACLLGGVGACPPEVLNFRTSEIASGAFQAIIMCFSNNMR